MWRGKRALGSQLLPVPHLVLLSLPTVNKMRPALQFGGLPVKAGAGQLVKINGIQPQCVRASGLGVPEADPLGLTTPTSSEQDASIRCAVPSSPLAGFSPFHLTGALRGLTLEL